jgi:sugar lactone lactonase YvrE
MLRLSIRIVLLAAAGCPAAAGARPVAVLQEAVVTTLRLSSELPSRGRLGGLAIDSDGNLVVSNFGASVWRLGGSGQVTRLAQELRGSSGTGVARDGTILQASFLDNRIMRISRDGSINTWASEGLSGPVGVVATRDGGAFVTNCRSNTISRVAPDGTVSAFSSGTLFDCPNGITFGPDGSLYVVNYNNGDVVRVDSEGRAALFAGIPESQGAHIAYARGMFYVTAIGANRIYRVSRDGRTVTLFAGTGEAALSDGPALKASLSRPNGIAVSPDSTAIFVNNLDGEWKSDMPTRIVIRRIDLPSGG